MLESLADSVPCLLVLCSSFTEGGLFFEMPRKVFFDEQRLALRGREPGTKLFGESWVGERGGRRPPDPRLCTACVKNPYATDVGPWGNDRA